MPPEPHRLVTGHEPWLRPDAHEARYDDSFQSFGEIAENYHREVISTPVAAHQMSMQLHQYPDYRFPAVSETGLPLTDIPLIVEGLLIVAKHLSDSGAPAESIEAILDHIGALTEGRT